MNFTIVDGYTDTFDEIYTDFERDYLTTSITCDELRRKYDLSKKKFSKLTRMIKQDKNLAKRPVSSKNYYRHCDGAYIISKKIDGKVVYFGRVSTEELAKRCVEICNMLEWDLDICRSVIWEMKQCS